MRYSALTLLFLTGCYASHVTIYEHDLDRLEGKTIRELQIETSYQAMDLGQALLFSSLSGIGMGFYESRVFYAGKSFPGQSGQIWDWYRSPHSGDEYLKIGDSDKLARLLWTSTSHHSRKHWLRYFGGNIILAYIAEFIVLNSVATVIRSYGKHGGLKLNIDIRLPNL